MDDEMFVAVNRMEVLTKYVTPGCYFCNTTNPAQEAVVFLPGTGRAALCICAACWVTMHHKLAEAEELFRESAIRLVPWRFMDELNLDRQERLALPAALPMFEEPPRAEPRRVMAYPVGEATRPVPAAAPVAVAEPEGEMPAFLRDRKPRLGVVPFQCPRCHQATTPLIVHQECEGGHEMPADYRKRTCYQCGEPVHREMAPGCPEHGPYGEMV